MDFQFDLSFLNDSEPFKAEDTIDCKQLAAKIAETNDLVLKIKCLEEEIQKADQNIVQLNNSVYSIKNLYDQERAQVEKLTAENEKLCKDFILIRKEGNQKQDELDRLILLNEQSKAEYESNLDKEKEKYTSLCVQFTSQAKKLHDHDLLDSKARRNANEIRKRLLESNITVPQLKSPKKGTKKKQAIIEKTVEKHTIGVNCNLLPTPEIKPETISKATQYITSTTTRSACTSAFIKTRTTGTNFPEPVSVTLEEALKATIFDIPAPISPIKDIYISTTSRHCGTQTEIYSSKSIGSCTKIKNIRKRIKFYEKNSYYPSRIITEAIKKESPMSSTTNLDYASSNLADTKPAHNMLQLTNPLLDLWNLLGRTIFALIHSGNSSLNQSQIGMLSERMDACNRHLQLEITSRPLSREDNYTKKDCFSNLLTHVTPEPTFSSSNSADSISMDDGGDTNSSTESSDLTSSEAHKVQFSSFNNIFKNKLPKVVVDCNTSNNFNDCKDRIGNKTVNISDNCKLHNSCKLIDSYQANETNCLKSVNKELAIESNYAHSNITNFSRKSVITKTHHTSSPEKQTSNLKGTTVLSKSLMDLTQDKEKEIIPHKNDSCEMQSLPEEEFVLALSCEDIDRNFPQGLEEIDEIVESFTTQEPFEQFNDLLDTTKTPIKLNMSECEATLQNGSESQGIEDKDNVYNKKREKIESALIESKQKYNQSSDNAAKEDEKDSREGFDATEGEEFSAVDEVLKMFSKLPMSRKKGKIKRLKCLEKSSKQRLDTKRQCKLKTSVNKCLEKNFKDKITPESVEYKHDRNSSENQIKIENENSIISKAKTNADSSEKISQQLMLNTQEKAGTSDNKIEKLHSLNNFTHINENVLKNPCIDSTNSSEKSDCESEENTSFLENQSANEQFGDIAKAKINKTNVRVERSNNPDSRYAANKGDTKVSIYGEISSVQSDQIIINKYPTADSDVDNTRNPKNDTSSGLGSVTLIELNNNNVPSIGGHNSKTERNEDENCPNSPNEQHIFKSIKKQDLADVNNTLNFENKMLVDHSSVNVVHKNAGENELNGSGEKHGCRIESSFHPENQIVADLYGINLTGLNNIISENDANVQIQDIFEDVFCFKRAKLEIDSSDAVIYSNKSTSSDTQFNESDDSKEDIVLERPSTPSNSQINNILKQYMLNISPISRICDSSDERSNIDVSENMSFSQSASNCHEDQNNIILRLEPAPESENSNESDFLGFPSEDMFDSPESPPSFNCIDYECVPKLIPLERSIEGDPNYSPLSPCHETNFCDTQKPVIIPELRIRNKKNIKSLSKLHSVLGRTIQKFDEKQQLLIASDKIQSESAAESKLIIKVRQALEHYVMSSANTTEVNKCIARLIKRSKNIQLISKAIIEIIEDTHDEILNDLTPPLPAMTETHRKIVILLHTLNCHIKGISDNIITMTEQRLFHLKPKNIPLETLINLTLLYIALIDLQDSEKNPARFFIYKCLYYYNKESVPMIYYVLVSYPAVLPKKSDPYYDRSDAIISSIQCILNSLIYTIDKKDLKHREVFHILKLYYEYDRVKPSREEVIENLMAKIKAGKFQNVSYSFALICKHNGIEWTEREVIKKHLLPALTEYYNLVLQSNAHDMNAATLLESLSFVLKPFPLNYNFNRYLQIFTNFLCATNRKIVQEAAVRAVLRIQRFGCVNCFNIICNWNPNYKIDSNLRVMLKSFVHRKALNFWRKVENQI